MAETNAQTTTDSPELIQLKQELAMAEAKQKIAEAALKESQAKKDLDQLSDLTKQNATDDKAIAEATRDALKAKRDMYAGPSVTAPTGAMTVDGVFIESRVLAHKALAECFKSSIAELTDKLKPDPVKQVVKLVLYNQADYQGLELLSSMYGQLEAYQKAFEKLNRNVKDELDAKIDPALAPVTLAADPLLAGYIAGGVLRTAADIVSLFKTTTDLKNFDIATDENLVTASFVKAAAGKGYTIYNPAVFPVNTITVGTTASALRTKLSELEASSALANTLIGRIDARTTALTAQAVAETDVAKKKLINAYIEKLADYKAQLKGQVSIFSQFQTALSTVDATSKTTPLVLLMRAEHLSLILNEKDAYTVKILALSKGSNKMTSNLWRNTKIEFSGGTELSVVVYAADGSIKMADSRYVYSSYVESSAIPKTSN